MLIQSHTGIVHLFPSLPKEWKDVSFNNLRTFGGFLVSSQMKNGVVWELDVKAENDGTIKLRNPFGKNGYLTDGNTIENNEIISIKLSKGETITLKAK